MSTQPPGTARGATAAHAVALYDSPEDLCRRVLPYVREGLATGEAVFAAVSEQAADALRTGLGDDAEKVRWRTPGVSFDHLGAMNEAVRSFLAGQHGAGVRTRLLTEDDVSAESGRTAAYLRIDAAATEAYGSFGLPWACLYDRRRHPDEVQEQAARIHPLLLGPEGDTSDTPGYIAGSDYVAGHPGPLSEVPGRVALDAELTRIADLAAGRRRVADTARALGLPAGDWDSVALAVGEVMTNALQHGVAPARVRVWSTARAVVVRVDDRGDGGELARAGFQRPDGPVSSGLCLVRQLADVVHVGVGRAGTAVELQLPVPRGEPLRDAHGVGSTEVAVSAFDQAARMELALEGPGLVVVAANASARARLGGRDPLGSGLESLEQAGSALPPLDAVQAAFNEQRSVVVREHRVRRPERAQSPDSYFNYECTPWRYADGTLRGVLVHGEDVTGEVNAARTADAVAAGRGGEHAGRFVDSLQRALLPAALPVLPSVQLAARYRPGARVHGGAGDWFDAVPLGAGRLALAVGDVPGHGADAALVMGRLLTVLRERLRAQTAEPDPERLLERAVRALDRFATEVPAAHAATVCIVLLETATGELRYCTAGHPPPLLARPDGTTRYLERGDGGPLATGSAVAVRTDRLQPGELLLLYSNGIIDRPNSSPVQGTVALAGAVGRIAAAGAGSTSGPTAGARNTAASAADRLCDETLTALAGDAGYTDDVVLMAAQRVAAPEPLSLTVPAAPASLRAVRTALSAWLAGVRAGDEDWFAVQHAVGELVANGVEHAYGRSAGPDRAADEPRLSVTARLSDDGHCVVSVRDHGSWRAHRPGPTRGLGLAMASGLVDDLHVERGEQGTTATVRRRLSRPVEVSVQPGSASADGARGEPAFSVRRPNEGGVTLAVAGPVDTRSARALADAASRLTRGGTASGMVDLTGVTHLSSAGVRVLYQAMDRCAGHGETLRLIAPPGSAAHHVLAVVGLDRLLEERPSTI